MRRLLAQMVMLALFAVTFVAGAAAQRIDRIAFFGDSLTDSGNNFIVTRQSTLPPFLVTPPIFSYDVRGHEFSNGPVWAEYLAAALHKPQSATPDLLSWRGEFTNYAIGDARSRFAAQEFPFFGLTTQVARFLIEFHGKVPANTLVVIWIGANDLDDALNALTTDPSGAKSLVIIEDALAAIAVNAQVLYRAGARMFLIANIPDLSKTPYVQFVGQTDPTIPTIASQFTNTFNVELAAGATSFGRQPGIQYFQLFDVDGLLNRVIASPGDFHLMDVKDRCTVPGVTAHPICDEPDSYLFWDAAHPTTAAHRIVAAAALSLLPPQ